MTYNRGRLFCLSERRSDPMTNVEAFAAAKHKARYGHKAQIVWRDHAGEFFFEQRTAASIKRALLSIGTAGRFTEIVGSTPFTWYWRDGVRMIRNARYGC